MTASIATLLLSGLLLAARSAAAEPPPPPDVPEPPPAQPEPQPAPDPEPRPEPDPAPEPESNPEPEPKPDPESDDDDDDDDASPFKSKYLTIEGYLQPQYTYRVRKGARPRDQQEFGAQQTRAGLIFKGHVLRRWSYRTHFVIGSQITRVVSDVDEIDYEGDGGTDDLVVQTQLVPGIDLEQLWVNYRAVEHVSKEGKEIVSLDFRLGQMRVPFSKQNKTQNNSLLFPRRNQAVTSFLVSSDLGGLFELNLMDARFSAAGGVFNGTGLAVNEDNRRGPLWAARLEIAPLEPVGDSESDLEIHEKPAFSLGTGMLYSPYRLFDNAGNDTLTRARDLLLSGSAKVVFHGLYVQGEFIRRQVTDNLSSRPFLSTGAYGQASFVIPGTKKFFVAPGGNFGWTVSEQAVQPLNRYFTADGVSLYLPNEQRLDAVRISLLYQGEWFVDEGQSAQGGTLQVQLKF